MELRAILEEALQREASDVHLRVGAPPTLRVQGALEPSIETDRLTAKDTARFAAEVMNQKQRERFGETLELDLSYSVAGLGRFRVSVFQQRGTLGLVVRVVQTEVPALASLNLPPVLERIASTSRGLVLVTGSTGSGKSTALAGIVDHINRTRSGHILTIEDPIEFLHSNKQCVVTQREVGTDTQSFNGALRAALRQDPDVILIGEIRDLETMEIALSAAETGHLVLATVHTLDATETVARIVSLFPAHRQENIRLQMASVLRAIVSLRLLRKADGTGRVPITEILVNTGRVKACLEDPARSADLLDAIAQGAATYGTQTFDQSLHRCFRDGLVTREEALRNASNPDDLLLRMNSISSSHDHF